MNIKIPIKKHGPRITVKNRIDQLVIDARISSNVLDVRSYRGADADSDIFLIGAKLRIKISSSKMSNPNEVNSGILQNWRMRKSEPVFKRKWNIKAKKLQILTLTQHGKYYLRQ